MRKEINEFHSTKYISQPMNFSQQNSILSKSSNLLELLKAKKGQNINIDISMLSNKGSLTNLIEKAKKYQAPLNSILENNSLNNLSKEKKQQNKEQSKIQKSINLKPNIKIHNQIEILEKFNKKKNENENENNFDDNNINDSNPENSEDTNEITSNKNLNNLNSESRDIYQKNFLKNNKALSSKTSSSGTLTKVSNKEKSDNSQQDDDVDSFSSSQKENNSKKYPKKIINNDTNYYKSNNTKIKTYKMNQKTYNPNFAIEYETVKENYSINSCNIVLEYSFREDQNIDSQPLMEDKSKSIENFNNSVNQMLFELFDGHGGEDISNFLQQNFAQIYKQYLEINNYDIPKSLTNTFKELDEMIKESLINVDGMGSTGTIVHLFWETNSKLMVYTGNVGDSRVSLISPTHLIRLSYDHRMSDEKEKQRILESGVEVIDNRIGGELMLTRIFGDYEFKTKDKKKGVICEPFLSKIKIDLNIPNQFLILASDGIWDLISEKEIQQMIAMKTNSEKLCAMIIKKALDRDSWDNMSVFAIKLT